MYLAGVKHICISFLISDQRRWKGQILPRSKLSNEYLSSSFNYCLNTPMPHSCYCLNTPLLHLALSTYVQASSPLTRKEFMSPASQAFLGAAPLFQCQTRIRQHGRPPRRLLMLKICDFIIFLVVELPLRIECMNIFFSNSALTTWF